MGLSGWSFHQLATFLASKAQIAGVPVVQVNPAYTSQTCPECGHCERSNRKSQSEFRCQACGQLLQPQAAAVLRRCLAPQPRVGELRVDRLLQPRQLPTQVPRSVELPPFTRMRALSFKGKTTWHPRSSGGDRRGVASFVGKGASHVPASKGSLGPYVRRVMKYSPLAGVGSQLLSLSLSLSGGSLCNQMSTDLSAFV